MKFARPTAASALNHNMPPLQFKAKTGPSQSVAQSLCLRQLSSPREKLPPKSLRASHRRTLSVSPQTRTVALALQLSALPLRCAHPTFERNRLHRSLHEVGRVHSALPCWLRNEVTPIWRLPDIRSRCSWQEAIFKSIRSRWWIFSDTSIFMH